MKQTVQSSSIERAHGVTVDGTVVVTPAWIRTSDQVWFRDIAHTEFAVAAVVVGF